MRTSIEIDGPESLRAILGEEIGPGSWHPVTQKDIDRFAEVSGDHQWIHVDPERARTESPYGTTIAHGNLTLSLVDGLRGEVIRMSGIELGVNYGWNRVRFPAPVPSGSRLRLRAKVLSTEDIGDGWVQVVIGFSLEVEGSEKPCFAGESVGRLRWPSP